MNRYRIVYEKRDAFCPNRYRVFMAVPHGDNGGFVFRTTAILSEEEIHGLKNFYIIDTVPHGQGLISAPGVILEYMVDDSVVDANPFFSGMFHRGIV